MLTVVTPPATNKSPILVSKYLDEHSLKALLENQICAIHVPSYTEPSVCERLSSWFLAHDKIEPYYHEIRDQNDITYLEYGVERVGVSYNTTYGRDSNSYESKRYYTEALPNIRRLREACYPYLSPIDRLRIELDEIWQFGANVASFEQKKMFVGIGRIMYPQTSHLAESQPHFDSVPSNLKHLEGQFSANIYLNMPQTGGELELWNVPPLPIHEIDNADLDTDWRSSLPKSFLIKPNQGDLVLINTRRAHAIRSFQEGHRVTVQCFIGYAKDKKLSLWN